MDIRRTVVSAIGRAQALADEAFAQEVRAIAAAHSRACKDDREFAADELALALGVGMRTAEGVLEDGELELAEVPGFGPILPRPHATWSRMRENWELSLAQLMSTPPKQGLMPEQLSSAAYATPSRLKRFLQARDRTCVFPGCHQRITDVDHRIPWPFGPTAADNLQLLCRHHHRTKQAVFTVELTPDGDYLWTTRGGWQFIRHRQGC